MLTVKETQTELSKDLEKLYSKPGKGKKDQDYLRHGAVALAMNKAFTQIGWDCVTEKVEVIKPAYRCNSGGNEDPAGTYWTAIASAVVTVKARSLMRADGLFTEVVRTCVGVGQAVSGKTNNQFDAIQNAITSAETAAFKRACRYFGPSTGLTLQFEAGEREAIQNQIDQANQSERVKEGGDQAVEGTAGGAVTGTMTSDMTPAATPQAQASPAAPTNGAGAGHNVPEVLRNLQDQAALNRIASLASDDTDVAPSDATAFQLTLVTSFERHGGIGIWKSAGLPLTKGSIVKRKCLDSVAQVLEEASVGPGGLEGFLAKFKSKPAQAAPVPVAQAAPVAPAPVAPAVPVQTVQGPTATVIINGQHVAGPAPTVPAPGKTQVEPSAQGLQPQVGQPTAIDDPARMTMGEQLHEMWESDLGKTERRNRYTKRFGGTSPEVVTILVDTPDDAEVTREIGAKVHVIGLARYQKLNQPSSVFDLWAKVGYSFGNGQPKGRQLRAFADALPD